MTKKLKDFPEQLALMKKYLHSRQLEDLRKITEAMADYFIICHGDSTVQTRAITDYLEEEVRKQTNEKPYHLEGRNNGEWCLIDFGSVIVHVFEKEKREFYQLEDLWSDGILKRYED